MRRRRPPRKPRLQPETRIHEEWDGSPYSWIVSYPPPIEGGGVIFESGGACITDYSKITGYTGQKGLWNPVEHFKVHGRSGSHHACYWDGGSEGFTHYAPDPNATVTFVPVGPDDLLAMVPQIKPEVAQRVIVRGLESATKQMPSKAELANFLVELRSGLRGILPRLRTLKDLLGGLHLGIQFGVKQFIRDLGNFATAFNTYRMRMKHLIQVNGLENWVHAARSQKSKSGALTSDDVVLPSPQITHEDFLEPLGGAGHVVHKLVIDPGSVVGAYHVNLLSKFMLEDLDHFWDNVDAIGAAFGLNNPVKFAWNATKLTWLLEYFVKVSPWLDKLAGDPFKGTCELRSAWTSYKVMFYVDVYVGRFGTASLTQPEVGVYHWDPTPSGRYFVKYYHRYPGIDPLPEDKLLSLNLTAQQAGILAALAESRLSWDKTKWTQWAVRKLGPWRNGLYPSLNLRDAPKWFRRRFRRRRR